MTGTRFLHHTFRPCRRTRRLSKEDTHENYFNCCSLFTGPDVYGLWVERISQLYPPAATHKSAGVTVFWRHRRIPLCRVLLRGAGVWWAVAALRPIRATSADSAG